MSRAMNRRELFILGSLFTQKFMLSGQEADPLFRLHADFRVESLTTLAIIRQLAIICRPDLLFCIERSPSEPLPLERRVSFAVQDSSLKMILDRVCTGEAPYKYTYNEHRKIINIQLRNTPKLYTEILSLPVAPRRMTGNSLPENLFRTYAQSSPEITEYKYSKLREYHAKHPDTFPAGSSGSLSQSVSELPSYNIILTAGTVRHQLNEVAAYTRHMQRVKSNHATTGWIDLYPVGWQFWIAPDANAQNGLGGFPQWSHFPR